MLRFFFFALHTKVRRVSRQQSPVQVMNGQKQLENVEYLNVFGSMMTNDDNMHVKLNCGIAMAKAAFNKKKAVFVSILGLN